MKFLLYFLLLFISVEAKITKVPYAASFEQVLPFIPNALHIEENKVYEKYYNALNDHSASRKYLIPNIIHFIWLGSPLPDICRERIETWKKWHPHWLIKIWDDADAAQFGMRNIQAFKTAANYGEKSDIFRYEILYRYGGIYADIDFECLRPFDDLHKSCEFYIGLFGNKTLLNGLIGSIPGHPILKACIDQLTPGNGDHNPERIMRDAGPGYITRIFLQTVTDQDLGKVVPFPPSFFYPFPAYLKDNLTSEEILQCVRPESYAIHYWTTSWLKK